MSESEGRADKEFYDRYYTERRYLEEGRKNAERRVDQMVSAGAAGTIVLSITFLGQLPRAPQTVEFWLVVVSWIVLLLALACSLTSLLTSAHAYASYMKKLDSARKQEDPVIYTAHTTRANTWTSRLNTWAVGQLLLGIILLGVFGVLTIQQQRSGAMTSGNKQQSTRKTPSRPTQDSPVRKGDIISTRPSPPPPPSDGNGSSSSKGGSGSKGSS